ncbi:MAG: fibrobacter succinogenes major paralogous domain-containing protein [Fibrobacter sp.]|nr:fibrobacter succinogenes major paralogous domain-containing protein [Fibrobacter sp.]
MSAVAFALFAFNACGDDSGSTSASGENGSLSSAVEDEESSSSINDNSSSSVTTGSDLESSSSSKTEGSSSSVKGSAPADGASSSSVISDPDRESSSSSVKSSSSSAKSSSSVNSSSSVKSSSSSSVKLSSSSVASSSSEWKPYNHKKAFFSDSVLTDAYKEFTYKGRSYYYLTINGKDKDGKAASVTVMAENLNVGEMVSGDKDQNDDSKIERYCYDNDTTNCQKYGGLYQWAEMMQLPSECNTKSCADQIKTNHQGICPDGWRLLTYDDLYIVVHANGNKNNVADIRATNFGGMNYSGYSLMGAGYLFEGIFNDLAKTTYWFYPEEISATEGFTNWSSNTTTSLNSTYHTPKSAGESVRCVKISK